MEINKTNAERMSKYPAKRFSFEGDDNSVKRRPKKLDTYSFGVIQLPFARGMKNLFPFELEISKQTPYNHSDAVWYRFKSDQEFEEATKWCDECGTLVFLYDCLDISMALGLNVNPTTKTKTKTKTPLGMLEDQAKHNRCDDSIKQISDKMAVVIKRFEKLKHADFICGVPKQESKNFHLPQEISKQVSKHTDITDISTKFEFGSNKASLKSVHLKDKWDTLTEAGILPTDTTMPSILNNKTVILIDDKYQSGTTMQFVASYLQNQGATEIYGLCAVKTMRNDDNTNQNK